MPNQFTYRKQCITRRRRAARRRLIRTDPVRTSLTAGAGRRIALQLVDAMLQLINQHIALSNVHLQAEKAVLEVHLHLAQMVLDHVLDAQQHLAKVLVIFDGICAV